MKKIIITCIIVLVGVGVVFSAILYSSLVTLDASKLITNDVKFIDNNSQINNVELKPQVEKDKDYKIVPLNDNWKHPLNPIYSLVYGEFTYNNSEKSRGVRVVIYELKRDNLLDFTYEIPQLPKFNATENLSFTDTVTLASQHDLTTNFPNKEKYKITNYPPLTPQEIESNRKLREQEDIGKAFTFYTTKVNEAYNLEKLGKKTEAVVLYQQIIETHKKVLETLNSNKEYIYPDGSKIQPTESNKQFTQRIIVEITYILNQLENTKAQM
jgi:hypothetical protein